MAGNIGSPLCAELNRIANNGVYPDRDDFLEEQGAANVWAGTTGLGLLGALNYIVDPSRTDNNYKGLTAVCNELAGTIGLSDVDALRTINHPAEVLLRGTTPQSAVFAVDASYPTGTTNSGYVYLQGASGNFISTPDATALDIVGDIDLRAKLALDTWIPTTANTIISKWLSTGNQRSYRLQLTTSGLLSLGWTTDGAVGTLVSVNSTVATGLLNGATKWVRATLDVDNGSSGNTATFYLSDDGITWTVLGSPVVTANIASIYSGTANLEVGSLISGTTELLAGKVFSAQVYNGIAGTKVLDADCSVVTSQSQTSFTAVTGQTMTVAKTGEQVNVMSNLGKAGSLLPVTVGSSTAADSNDAKFLDHTGTNYVYLPGTSGDLLSVPNAAPLQVTGDIDLRWYGVLDSISVTQPLINRANSGSTRSYRFEVNSTGTLQMNWSADGTNAIGVNSTVAITAVGTPIWLRATLSVASNYAVNFYTSTNGTTWTQLGTTVTGVGATSIVAGNSDVWIGRNVNSVGLSGKIYRAQIFNGIDGTKVLDVDTSVITTGAATSFTAVTGQTVTINRSTSGRKTVAVTQPTWLFGTDDYMEVNNRYMAHSTSDENYVYLSGASGNYMSVADNPPLDVTGDLDLQVKVALDDWTPSANNSLIYKWDSAGTSASYGLRVNATSGVLIFLWTENGSTVKTATSTVAPTVTDGSALWIRATLDVNNGASGNTVTFYTSTDGTNWTQLGSAITTAGVTSIFSGTGPLEIGSFAGGLVPAKGKFYRAIIKNGIDGTTVLDANAATITLPSQTTFTDSSSNAYTVTINKSSVGTFVSTGNYLYLPGVGSNYGSAPDSAALDVTGDLDLRVKVALDNFNNSTQQQLISKWQSNTQYSYILSINSSNRLQLSWSPDGTNTNAITVQSTVTLSTISAGTIKWLRATLDVDNGAAGRNIAFYTSDDGITWTQLGTTVTTAGTTSIFAGTSVLTIGTDGINPNGNLARGKFFRAQVLNGINGTVAFDANFEGSITSLNQASFTESSSNAATVTINRSGSAYRSAGVIDAGYLYPGATNTFSNSTTDFLNFGATDSFTVLAIVRQWATPSTGRVINKAANSGSFEGYTIRNSGTSNAEEAYLTSIVSGSVGPITSSPYTFGQVFVTSLVVNRSTQLASIVTNNSFTSTSISSVGTLANVHPLRIGNASAGNNQYGDFEFLGAAVFRSVLTPKNISDINNYFQGRD